MNVYTPSSNLSGDEQKMSDGNKSDKNLISDVIGSTRCGRWDGIHFWANVISLVFGLVFLSGGLAFPLLFVYRQVDITVFVAMLIVSVPIGLGFTIYFGRIFVKIKRSKALLRRCLEENDLHRSSAEVIVTTASTYGWYRTLPTITLRFKVDGKKHEKRKLRTIAYAEHYSAIDILYSVKYDEVFLLKIK